MYKEITDKTKKHRLQIKEVQKLLTKHKEFESGDYKGSLYMNEIDEQNYLYCVLYSIRKIIEE